MVMIAAVSTTVWAQEGGAAPAAPASSSGPGTMSVFKMFFNPVPANPGVLDWIGVFQVWLLVILSVVAVGLIIQAFLRNAKTRIMPPELIEQLQQMIAARQFREALELVRSEPSFFAKLMVSAFDQAPNGVAAMERAMEETGDVETTKLLRPLEFMSIMGNVAPMLGLFGTVYGMIVAFQGLVEAGGKPNPAELAGGISTALVTTFWGLVIAMPCVTCYVLIRNGVDAATSESIMIADELLKQVVSPKKAAAPGATAAAPAAPGSAAPKPRAAAPAPKPDSGNPPQT
jgi:biopolymer transport protein ExbB